ncbi:MAG: hypothetical protein CMK32_06505 [Porticoccaceae bacterium]|nr:hypothetical protein [Porticoccaceae bacterium]
MLPVNYNNVKNCKGQQKNDDNVTYVTGLGDEKFCRFTGTLAVKSPLVIFPVGRFRAIDLPALLDRLSVLAV